MNSKQVYLFNAQKEWKSFIFRVVRSSMKISKRRQSRENKKRMYTDMYRTYREINELTG